MTSTTLKDFLDQLHKNHQILKAREAKYATAAPLDLLNQIDDYEQALALTEQALDREISVSDLQAEFGPLNLELNTVVFVGPDPLKPFSGRNPYRGLRKFTEEDAEFFFGRTAATQSLLDLTKHIIAQRSGPSPTLLTVLGPSGSGKSSLTRAGLIPALRTGGLPGSDQWLIKVMLPGVQPLNELAAQFIADTGRGLPALRADLNSGPQALQQLILESLAEKSDEALVVLVIDQFEELFTLCEDSAERESFLTQLLQVAYNRRGRALIILTMRADFYGKAAHYKTLAEAITHHQMLVSPLTERERREAILLPAESVGLTLEKALVERVLHDTANAPGVLPLLQNTLLALFERRQGNLLTLAAYQEIGGVKGSLAHRANEIMNQLTPRQQQIARQIFMRLVQPGEGTPDSRRRATFAEVLTLNSRVEEIEAVIQILADTNLLVTSRNQEDNQIILDVSHEALVQEWPRFRTWLDEDRRGFRLRQRLSRTALDWQAHQRDSDSLYRGARLLEAEEWVAANPGQINPLEKAFLEASLTAREQATSEQHQRTRRIIIGLTVALILVGLGAVFGLTGMNRALQAERSTQARALSAFALAEVNERSDPSGSLALLLAREAVLFHQNNNLLLSPEADAALRQAVDSAPPLHLSLPQPEANLDLFQPVEALTYSPDGQFIAVASGLSIRVWDAVTGQEIRTLIGHSQGVTTVAYSPDGRFILSAGQDGAARLWDAATGEQIRQFQGGTANFSPDGQYLATAKGTLTPGKSDSYIWDTATGQQILAIIEDEQVWPISKIIYSPDGQSILTARADGVIRIREATTGQPLLTLEGSPRIVVSAAFSHDGQSLATAIYSLKSSGNGTLPTTGLTPILSIWDAATGRLSHTLNGHVDIVRSISYSPDDKFILTASDDHTARIWDAASGQQLYTIPHSDKVTTAAFSPDGHFIVTGSVDGLTRVWAARFDTPARSLIGHTGRIMFAAFSPDSQQLVTVGQDGDARIWEVNTRQEVRPPLEHDDWVTSAGFSPDGQYLVTGRGNLINEQGVITVWDAASGEQLREIAHNGGALSVAFSPNGRHVAASGRGETAYIYEIETGRQIQALKATNFTFSIDRLAYSPDGQSLVGAASDHKAYLWEVESGRQIRIFEGHTDSVASAAFSPDGRLIVTASADGSARVWRTGTGDQVHHLSGHTGRISSAAFSPDGTRIVTTGEDRTARVWDTETGTQLRILEGHAAEVTFAAFSPNGQFLVTTSADRTARIWTTIEDLLEQAESLIVRKPPRFTLEERQRFLGEE